MILLDTHAAIWLAEKQPMRPTALKEIARTRQASRVLLSAVSVWEMSFLIAKRQIALAYPLGEWVRQFVTTQGFDSVSLTVPMAIEGASLPECDMSDPADRLLVATARHLDIPIVTRDWRILTYAKGGYVKTIAC